MHVMFATDLHGIPSHYTTLLETAEKAAIDVIILGGDLLPIHGPFSNLIADQKRFILTFLKPTLESFKTRQPETQILLLHGNNDWQTSVNILATLELSGMLRLLHNRKTPLGHGWEVIGYAHVPPTPFRIKDHERRDLRNEPVPEISRRAYISQGHRMTPIDIKNFYINHPSIEEELRELPSPTANCRSIYVMHSPPYGTPLDQMFSGQHVGSKAIYNFLDQLQPDLSLHGHIHEAPVVSGTCVHTIGRTLCVNPGHSPERLQAIIFELDDTPASMHHRVLGRASTIKWTQLP